ncbi:MAG TPA: hypothetical protein VMT88_05360 [Actinomycetes bacterium]|nr:hypothetical protein [Actinomycetes bacterium]
MSPPPPADAMTRWVVALSTTAMALLPGAAPNFPAEFHARRQFDREGG